VIPGAYAEDVDIMSIPQKVGESLGIPEPDTAFVGGLLISSIVLLAFVLPTLLLRNRAPSIIILFMVLSFEVTISWLPSWIIVMAVLIVAGMMANKIRRIFT